MSNDKLLLQCLALWERVAAEERWNKSWGLKATAAAQRLTLSLAHFADTLYGLTQPHAEAFQVTFQFFSCTPPPFLFHFS